MIPTSDTTDLYNKIIKVIISFFLKYEILVVNKFHTFKCWSRSSACCFEKFKPNCWVPLMKWDAVHSDFSGVKSHSPDVPLQYFQNNFLKNLKSPARKLGPLEYVKYFHEQLDFYFCDGTLFFEENPVTFIKYKKQLFVDLLVCAETIRIAFPCNHHLSLT